MLSAGIIHFTSKRFQLVLLLIQKGLEISYKCNILELISSTKFAFLSQEKKFHTDY